MTEREPHLRRVNVRLLEAGMVFDRPLLAHDGGLLLNADQELSPELCSLLHTGMFEVFAPAAAAPPMLAPDAPAELSNSPDDPTAIEPVPTGTPRRVLWERQRRASLNRGELRHTADALVDSKKTRWARLPKRVLTLSEPRPLGASSVSTRPALGETERLARAELWANVITRALDEGTADLSPILDLADEIADLAARTPGALVLDALEADEVDPASPVLFGLHAIRIAALAALSAARLGWSELDARDAALTALLADSGMLLLPHSISVAPRPLVDEEFNQVRRHPAFSVAIINRLVASDRDRAVPERVELAVYQHHERDNARGYPDLVPARALHDLAKLVGACDVMVGLSSQRAHRPAFDPAAAIRELVHGAARGELNGRSVRAIIDVCGIYPPGSRVRLSTGHAGQVIAKGPGDGLRPTVRLLSARTTASRPTLNLAESTNVRVLGPIAA